eukprot:6867496-Karenia_brevis.AAC.1
MLRRSFEKGERERCSCATGDERCIQAIEAEVPEKWIQVVQSDKRAKSNIERRLKLNFQVAQ